MFYSRSISFNLPIEEDRLIPIFSFKDVFQTFLISGDSGTDFPAGDHHFPSLISYKNYHHPSKQTLPNPNLPIQKSPFKRTFS